MDACTGILKKQCNIEPKIYWYRFLRDFTVIVRFICSLTQVTDVCSVRAKRPRRDMPVGDVFISLGQDDPIWTSIRSVVWYNWVCMNYGCSVFPKVIGDIFSNNTVKLMTDKERFRWSWCKLLRSRIEFILTVLFFFISMFCCHPSAFITS